MLSRLWKSTASRGNSSHKTKDDGDLRHHQQPHQASHTSRSTPTTANGVTRRIRTAEGGLPTTYRPSVSSTSFLMGGQYYPGKDQRRMATSRRRIKHGRRSWAHSKLWIGSLLALVLLWGWWTFGTNWVLRPRRDILADWSAPPPDHLQALLAARDQLEARHRPDRLRQWQQLATDWFFRNAPPRRGRTMAPIQQVTKDTEDRKLTASATANHNSRADAPGKETATKAPKPAQIPPAKVNQTRATASTEEVNHTKSEWHTNVTLRTIHNMDHYRNWSQCPPSTTANETLQTTLVIQATPNRLPVLRETCRRWKDPIVVVISLPSAASTLSLGWTDQDRQACPHVQAIPYLLQPSEERAEDYPVNRLRNLGLDAVRTSHILVADVDFVPAQDLADTIRRQLQQRYALVEGHVADFPALASTAYVVPAFERKFACDSDETCQRPLLQNSSVVPHDLTALKDCLLHDDCSVFQHDNNWEGHHSTRSADWLAEHWMEETPQGHTDMRRLKCFDSLRYEPYVVLEWCRPVPAKVPYYDERFQGYGKNKIELIQHLRLMGYQFYILPQGFLVHYPHVESAAKETWNNVRGNDLHRRMDQLYPQFLHELLDLYKPTRDSVVDQC